MSRKKRRKKHREEETDAVEAAAAAGPEDAHDDDDGHEDVEGVSATAEELGATDPEENASAAEAHDAELDRLAAEAKDMRLLAQRKQAEFENYRKRIERERAETIKYAAADVVKEMLPVLDNLERAVDAAKSGHSKADQLIEGVEIISKQFRDTLVKLGLSEVEADNAPFDPHVHEAVSRVETDEHPEGTVVEVLQKGYLFKDRLLRPSMVSVALPANGGAADSQEDRETEDEAVPQKD